MTWLRRQPPIGNASSEAAELKRRLVPVGSIQQWSEDGVSWVQLNRPERLNALDFALCEELSRALGVAEDDAEIEFIVILGLPKAFSTGADLEEMSRRIRSPTPHHALAEWDDVMPHRHLKETTKLTIAGVSGWCIGGGLLLAMLCDFIVASEDACFAVPEGRLGMADEAIARLLAEYIGPQRAKWVTCTASTVTASDAATAGLATRVCSTERLLDTILSMIRELKQTSYEARRRYKEYFTQARGPVQITKIADVLTMEKVVQQLLERDQRQTT